MRPEPADASAQRSPPNPSSSFHASSHFRTFFNGLLESMDPQRGPALGAERDGGRTIAFCHLDLAERAHDGDAIARCRVSVSRDERKRVTEELDATAGELAERCSIDVRHEVSEAIDHDHFPFDTVRDPSRL